MGYLYKANCYDTGQQVADLMSTEGVQGNSFFGDVNFTGTAYAGLVTTIANGAASNVGLEIPAVLCDPVGPVAAGSRPMTLADTIEVSWLIVAVWIVVWSVKSLKRAI